MQRPCSLQGPLALYPSAAALGAWLRRRERENVLSSLGTVAVQFYSAGGSCLKRLPPCHAACVVPSPVLMPTLCAFLGTLI